MPLVSVLWMRRWVMEILWRDLKYGIRGLAKARGFSAVAILTLAVGIGANTTIFSAVNGILLKPLPYADSSRLVEVGSRRLAGDTSLTTGISVTDIKGIAAQCPAFSELAEYQTRQYTLTGQTTPEILSGADVSGNFFPLLGVKPLKGRSILPSDISTENRDVALVSYGAWRGLLGGNADIIGGKLTLNGQVYTVIGVMPPEFTYAVGEQGIWTPLTQVADASGQVSRLEQVVARLQPSATLAETQAQLKVLSARLAATFPKTDGGTELYAEALKQREFIYGDFRQDVLLQLLVAVGFVLLIACANIGSLLLARGFARQKEMAIRQAMGASRGRIVRQVLTESILLGLVGGGVGLLFSLWGVQVVRAAAPSDTPRLMNVQLDANVVLFTLAISLLAGVLFGIGPALQVSSGRVGAMRSDRSSGALQWSLARWPRKLPGTLIVGEVALSLILAAGAMLTIKSFKNWVHVNWGFQSDHILTMTINFSKPVCDEESKSSKTQCYLAVQDILGRLASLPGVRSVAAASTVPLEGVGPVMSLRIQGRTETVGFAKGAPVFYRVVTPGYFVVLGTTLMKGRDFTITDGQGSASVVIVNEAFAKEFLSNNPLGKQISERADKQGKPEWMTVVGEVGDTLIFGPQAGGMPEFYEPYSQSQQTVIANVIVRTARPPIRMAIAVKQQIWAVDKDAPITNLKTMDQIVAGEIAEPRFVAVLLGGFGVLGLILGMIGIYGVISYGVTRRTHEIAVRLALGAVPANVLRMIVRECMLLSGIGIALGIGGSFAVTRFLRSVLFEVTPTNPNVFVGATVLLLGVALVACWIPARRAMRVDPMVVLRHE